MKPFALLVANVLILTACAVNKPGESPTKAGVVARPVLASASPPVPNPQPAGASAVTAATAQMGTAVPVPGPGEPRKYSDVITKDVKTSRGMVLHHKIKERHLFEIRHLIHLYCQRAF